MEGAGGPPLDEGAEPPWTEQEEPSNRQVGPPLGQGR